MKCIFCKVSHSLPYGYPVTCPSMLLLKASLMMAPYSNTSSSSWLCYVSNSTSFRTKSLTLYVWPCIRTSTGESFHNSIEMKIKRRKRIKLYKYIWKKIWHPIKETTLNLISQLHSESILHSNDKSTLPCSAVWLMCTEIFMRILFAVSDLVFINHRFFVFSL